TFGLGGDSEIRLEEQGLVAGPRRVMPLSLLAHQHPAMLDVLREQAATSEPLRQPGRFAIRQRALDAGQASLNPTQAALWNRLGDGPRPLATLLASPAAERALGRLVDRGRVLVAAFAPSAAAHILGLQKGWSDEAARLGADIFRRATPQGAWKPPADAAGFAQQVVEQVVRQSGQVILASAIADEDGIAEGDWGRLGHRLVDRALSGNQAKGLLELQFRLGRPLVAIGAPVGAYYPQVAER